MGLLIRCVGWLAGWSLLLFTSQGQRCCSWPAGRQAAPNPAFSPSAVCCALCALRAVRAVPCRLPEAEAACRKALDVLEGALGPRHPAVTTALSNVIALMKRQGKEAEADATYRLYHTR